MSYRVIQNGTESYTIVRNGTESYRVVCCGTLSYRNNIIRNNTGSYTVLRIDITLLTIVRSGTGSNSRLSASNNLLPSNPKSSPPPYKNQILKYGPPNFEPHNSNTINGQLLLLLPPLQQLLPYYIVISKRAFLSKSKLFLES